MNRTRLCGQHKKVPIAGKFVSAGVAQRQRRYSRFVLDALAAVKSTGQSSLLPRRKKPVCAGRYILFWAGEKFTVL